MAKEKPLKPKRPPTPRQVKAVQAVLENLKRDKPESLKSVLESVGYGAALQDQPGRVTESTGFQKLLAEHLPEENLTKKHKELLNSINLEKINFNVQDTDVEIRAMVDEMEGYKLLKIKDVYNHDRSKVIERIAYVKAPNALAQDKALDKAYKLRGLYLDEKTPEKPSLNVNYHFIFSGDVQDKIKTINRAIREKFNAQTT